MLNDSSLQKLALCHPNLQRAIQKLAEHVNFQITCSYRSPEEQDRLFAIGRTQPGKPVTKAKGGESPHNYQPALAVDIAPDGVNTERWGDKPAFAFLAGQLVQAARDLNIDLQWGGDWNGNGWTADDGFDMPHVQIHNWKELAK